MIVIHNNISFSYEKEWNPTICSMMDSARGDNIKWNKPDPDIASSPLYVGG